MNSRRLEIIGGGVAGLSLGAALAREGIPTTVFEAGNYPRHRVCGEFIAGLSERDISTLRLEAVLEGAILHRSVGWFHGDRQTARQTLKSPAWGISRRTLDARLAEAFVAAGGELRTNTRVENAACPVGRVLTTGRAARVSDWVGLKMHISGVALTADLEVHLGRSSYVGLCRVEDGWINVCGLFSRAGVAHQKGESLLRHALKEAGLFALERRLSVGEIRDQSEMATAGLSYAEEDSDEGRLRVGDAMASIPPFTGRGMALAFQSAAQTLPSLRAWARGECSWVRAVSEAKAAMRLNAGRSLGLARRLHPWLFRPCGQRVFSIAHRAKILPMNFLTRVLHG